PYRRQRAGILLIELPHFLLASGHLARALHDGARDLLVGHRDLVSLADLGQHETEPNPSLGDAAVLFPRLLFGRALVGEAAALGLEIAVDRVPDVLELLLGQGRRKREFMHLVELIKKLAFDPLAAEPGVLLLQSSFD